jgi:hypothetical protein
MYYIEYFDLLRTPHRGDKQNILTSDCYYTDILFYTNTNDEHYGLLDIWTLSIVRYSKERDFSETGSVSETLCSAGNRSRTFRSSNPWPRRYTDRALKMSVSTMTNQAPENDNRPRIRSIADIK